MTELENQNLNAYLYPAKINKIGWMGCRDSHLSCLVKIFANQEVSAIFEDDIKFLTDISVATEAMTELPSDWDILYLGCSPQAPQEQYSPHLFKITKALTTHAMIWNVRENGALEYCLTADDEYRIGKWDVFLMNEVQPKFNCFCTYPMVCTQADFQSDTCRRSDVSTIVTNYNRFCV
jgi:hypothetical protein